VYPAPLAQPPDITVKTMAEADLDETVSCNRHDCTAGSIAAHCTTATTDRNPNHAGFRVAAKSVSSELAVSRDGEIALLLLARNQLVFPGLKGSVIRADAWLARERYGACLLSSFDSIRSSQSRAGGKYNREQKYDYRSPLTRV
jgi:hypothetical protein